VGRNKQEFDLPAQGERSRGRKTLVLDLDETLVHSAFQPVDNVDIVLPVNATFMSRSNSRA
jgi:RNA polymerase II subunit A small phosphatase-like protein